MKKAELLRRIEALEARIAVLEARPVYAPYQPYVVPTIPWMPPVWCGDTTTATPLPDGPMVICMNQGH